VTHGAIYASVPGEADITLLAANDLTARWTVENRYKTATVEEDDRLLLMLKARLEQHSQAAREDLCAAFCGRFLSHIYDLHSWQRHLPDPIGEIKAFVLPTHRERTRLKRWRRRAQDANSAF
jgi:hypothetical protein